VFHVFENEPIDAKNWNFRLEGSPDSSLSSSSRRGDVKS
jgi:hypothetical protein